MLIPKIQMQTKVDKPALSKRRNTAKGDFLKVNELLSSWGNIGLNLLVTKPISRVEGPRL